MKIFIAGCARSGTSAFRAQLGGLPNTHVVPVERHFTKFHQFQTEAENVVLKRTAKTRHDLHDLPSDIRLFYCVRHPYDSMTSAHNQTKDIRPYHVLPERWVDEYDALKRLERAQPARKICFIRYETLCIEPLIVQREIEDFLGLHFEHPIGAIREVRTSSVLKWQEDRERIAYLKSLPADLMPRLQEFTKRFDYDLAISDQTAPARLDA